MSKESKWGAKTRESVHIGLFSRDRNTPIRYNNDPHGLDADARKRIEDIKQRKNVPLIDESAIDDPFFP